MGVAVLALGACIGPQSIQGPVWGTVETRGGPSARDVVVYLRCSSHDLHGASPSDLETRVVDSGERYLFVWAYRGISPVGCAVRTIHPLYVSSHARVESFRQALPTFTLESWDDHLEGDPPVRDDPGHPWPERAFAGHLLDLELYYLPAIPGARRAESFRTAMPELHRLFEQVRVRLGRGPHTQWSRSGLTRLRAIERLVDYAAPQEELFRAARDGDTEQVRTLAAGGVMLGAFDPKGDTALYLAARAGNTETVVALLDLGAQIDRGRSECRTPFLGALGEDRWETVATLVRRGASIEIDCKGQRILGWRLHGLARLEDPGALRLLLGAGIPADTHMRGGVTPLLGATDAGRVASVRLLLEAGADPHARASDGRSPISVARERGAEELLALLESGRTAR